MQYKLSLDGDLNKVEDFCGNLSALLDASLKAGLKAIEGRPDFLDQRQEVQYHRDRILHHLQGDIEPSLLMSLVEDFLSFADQLLDAERKYAYSLGFRDSMRVQSLLWPREMPGMRG